MTEFMDTMWWSWVVLPLLIFLSRILDQSIGTLRVIFVSKGLKNVAPFFGFFEVIIWLLAVTQVMKHLNNPMSYIAYGAGFAMGNYLGILLEEKLSLGTILIRVIPRRNTDHLIARLRALDFGVTVVDAEGVMGTKVKVLLTIVRRKHAQQVIEVINSCNPNAFYTIEEVKAVREGYFGIALPGNSMGKFKEIMKRK
jgi:uncharacterized protein YebE (UPF0316 family)